MIAKGRYPSNGELLTKIDDFAREYQDVKLERGLADYDDLLVYCLEVLSNNQEAAQYYQNRFSHILVDEYQDVNSLQAQIVDKIGINHQIMAVGDDAQCIYTWRGADLDQIMGFPEKHPETKIFKIETNYRSSPEILKLANCILDNRAEESSYSKVLKASCPHQGLPVVVPTMDGYQQADFVLAKVEQLVDSGAHYDDIAILYRAHYHAMELQVELSRRGMPFVITSGLRFSSRLTPKTSSPDTLVANPKDLTAFRFACLLPKVGEKTAAKLLGMAEKIAKEKELRITDALAEDSVFKKVPADAKEDWTDLVETLQSIDRLAGNATPTKVVDEAIHGWYQEYLRATYENWPRREEDLESLVDFASKHENLHEMLSQLVLLSSESGDRVGAKAKDAFACPPFISPRGWSFPMSSSSGLTASSRTNAPLTGKATGRRKGLFYVDHRAERSLHLVFPMLSNQKGTPVRLMQSRFLKELPESQYELHNAHSSYRQRQAGWNDFRRQGRGYGRSF